ncbi:MAG: DUF2971 domain-containing protein [Dorea sp.]|jgi:hypothetical protein|nr:DUF2971 domain-containing protein [Dorea sp.]
MSGKQVKLEQAEKGSILYHYTKSNGINGIVNHNCFWATKSDFLNDPNEFSHIYGIIDQVCGENIKDPVLKEMFLEDTIYAKRGKNREYFVLSFSKCRDSITMWSEFGNKTGYNIGFRSDDIIARIEEAAEIAYHGLVVYDEKKQRQLIRKSICNYLPDLFQMSLEDVLEERRKELKDSNYLKACGKFQRTVDVYAMFFKNSGFSQEQEYRFVFKKQKGTNVYFRAKDGFMLPYIEILMSEKNLPVEEIMIAPQNHIDLAKSGVEYMLHTKGYKAEVSLSNIKLRY